MTQNNENQTNLSDPSLDIRRPQRPEEETRGPGTGHAARSSGNNTSSKRPIMVSKTYSLPEKLSIQLKVASAVTNREQDEILAEALEPHVQKIIREHIDLVTVPDEDE